MSVYGNDFRVPPTPTPAGHTPLCHRQASSYVSFHRVWKTLVHHPPRRYRSPPHLSPRHCSLAYHAAQFTSPFSSPTRRLADSPAFTMLYLTSRSVLPRRYHARRFDRSSDRRARVPSMHDGLLQRTRRPGTAPARPGSPSLGPSRAGSGSPSTASSGHRSARGPAAAEEDGRGVRPGERQLS